MSHKKTSFQDLNLSNAFLFAVAMEDEETCAIVVETILGKKIGKVTVQVEKSLLYNSEFRSIRLDVFARDEAEVTYNLEMQNEGREGLAQRSRFHQAQMDVNSLRPGEDYEDLPPSYVIFICNFDPFGKGLYQYTFVQRCREEDFPLEDGTTRIFINTKGKNPEEISPELKHLLEYVNDSTDSCTERLEDESIRKLHEKVKTLKKNRTLEGNFMRMDEYIRGQVELRAKDMAEDMAKDMAEDMAKDMAKDMVKDMAKDMAEDMAKDMAKDIVEENSRRMLSLVNIMLSSGDADKIPLLEDNKDLLDEMFQKYNL